MHGIKECRCRKVTQIITPERSVLLLGKVCFPMNSGEASISVKSKQAHTAVKYFITLKLDIIKAKTGLQFLQSDSCFMAKVK